MRYCQIVGFSLNFIQTTKTDVNCSMPKYIMIKANNEFNGQEMMFNLFLMTNVFRTPNKLVMMVYRKMMNLDITIVQFLCY